MSASNYFLDSILREIFACTAKGYFDGKSLRHGLQEWELDPGYYEGEARPVEVCSSGRGGRHACPCEAEVQGDAAPATVLVPVRSLNVPSKLPSR